MKTFVTTAEQAVASRSHHGMHNATTADMLAKLQDIRTNEPWLSPYLDHPEITIGLAEGRFGIAGLARRLNEMEQADSGENEFPNG